jgi:hypothetical protein
MAITDAVIVITSMLQGMTWSDLTPEQTSQVKERRAKLELVSKGLVDQLNAILAQYGADDPA